jgi:hypothetical protein
VGYFPSPHPVVHIARRFTGTDPDTGNPQLVTDPPVVRWAQELVQQNSSDDLNEENLDRVEVTIQMAVDDPTFYCTDDQVIINPQLNPDKTWVTGTGEAYWVDGTPDDNRQGPWPDLFKAFGGILMLKRVT